MEVWQMDRVMISYVSVDVVVAARGCQRTGVQSCRVPASLTSLSVGADLHNVDHDNDLDANPLAAVLCGSRAAGIRPNQGVGRWCREGP